VLVLVALNSSEYKISDVELAGAHIALMVAPQGLLVLGASQQRYIARLVDLVDHVLECDLVAFVNVGLYSWTAVVNVCGQDCFRAMYHEKGHEACGTTRCVLTVNRCIKVHLDLQADKSPVVVKGPFFPRVVNPRYRIRGTNCDAKHDLVKPSNFDLW
jgi:hypothetical protein